MKLKLDKSDDTFELLDTTPLFNPHDEECYLLCVSEETGRLYKLDVDYLTVVTQEAE